MVIDTNSDINSTTLDLENLKYQYKNLLMKYKQLIGNYVNFMKEQIQKQTNEFSFIKGFSVLGDSSVFQSQIIVEDGITNIQDCEAACIKNKCKGATFNPSNHNKPICTINTSNTDSISVIPSLIDDYAIVPKSKKLLSEINEINQQLIKLNETIQSKIGQGQQIYNEQNTEREQKQNELKKVYENLLEERREIEKAIDEYRTLDNTQNYASNKVNQNYFIYMLMISLILLMFIFSYRFFSQNIIQATKTIVNVIPKLIE